MSSDLKDALELRDVLEQSVNLAKQLRAELEAIDKVAFEPGSLFVDDCDLLSKAVSRATALREEVVALKQAG